MSECLKFTNDQDRVRDSESRMSIDTPHESSSSTTNITPVRHADVYMCTQQDPTTGDTWSEYVQPYDYHSIPKTFLNKKRWIPDIHQIHIFILLLHKVLKLFVIFGEHDRAGGNEINPTTEDKLPSSSSQMDTKRSLNDTARLRLIDTPKTSLMLSQTKHSAILNQQQETLRDKNSSHYAQVSASGWALRTRKQTARIKDNVKNFIEQIWLKGKITGRKVTPELVVQRIRTERKFNNDKLFEPSEYITANQVKYQLRKFNKKYEIETQQEFIDELV
ncbi:unnamed protein product [Didymodactylos carnosus]|uniref:Uncharacterized protein n=1 Tax=Didymodactylos carnosus TaxID=1234261 RepID=A0A814WJ74_9BILA|nr:unnamed protein product [Didymodactylos carnosus]CAF1572734.1 unnamed protein product [Didymodactylos carnosus]CAF3967389.1 unnamed protein product [Didymodactylos carnosus]CAF4367821.1 unnamed protein product [Didymodactylos carnosus]